MDGYRTAFAATATSTIGYQNPENKFCPPQGFNMTNAQPEQQAVYIQIKETLAATMLATKPLSEDQRQMLGEQLYPLVQLMCPYVAGRITGMLIELQNISEILYLLENKYALQAKIEEAIDVLAYDYTCKPLTAAMLADESPTNQRKMVTERLFLLIKHMYPNIAYTITKMILQNDISELFNLLKYREELEAAVKEAVAALKSYQLRRGIRKTKVRVVQQHAVQEQETLTAAMLAAESPSDQRQILGNRLFPLIQRMYPYLAGKITGMLIEIDISEILHLLEDNDALEAKVKVAIAVLGHHYRRKPLTASMLAAVLPSNQKRVLAERIFLLINYSYPDLAYAITEMLLKLDIPDLLNLIKYKQPFTAAVVEAVAALNEYQLHKNNRKTKEKPVQEQVVHTQEQEPLISNELSSDEENMLGERLFPLIQHLHPDLAGKITGMLLELDKSEILHMLEDNEGLEAKVEEAKAVFELYQIRKGKKPLTATVLVALSPTSQKQILAERLSVLIQQMYPELADKITEMLLGIDISDILYMLEENEALKAKVEETVAVLKLHQEKNH